MNKVQNYNFIIEVKKELIFEVKNDGSALVIDMDTGRLFEANHFAYVLMKGEMSISNIALEINEKCGIEIPKVYKDIDVFIEKIEELNWIKEIKYIDKKAGVHNLLSDAYQLPCIYEYDMSKGYFSKFISKKSGFDT